MDDFDTTYYIDAKCISTDNAYKSPYGEFEKAYVVVTASNDNYEYYWTSVDDAGRGVKTLKKIDGLDGVDIESDINIEEIVTTVGIDGRDKIVKITGEECVRSGQEPAKQMMNVNTGVISKACPVVTNTIYWAINNNKLTISDSQVSGSSNGSFPGNSIFEDESLVPWRSDWHIYENISEIEVVGSVAPLSTSNWFYYVGSSAESFSADLSNLEVCNVINMPYMFYGTGGDATSWSITGLSNWNTSKVENMRSMFQYSGSHATQWTVNGLESLDTSKVSNMYHMFEGAGQYANTFSLNLSAWNMSNVENIEGMFYSTGQEANTFSLNLSNWNLAKAGSLTSMFYFAGAMSPTFSVNVTNWNTSNITGMRYLFERAGAFSTTFTLQGLNTWNTSNVTDMSNTLLGIGSEATTFNIDISNWDMSSVTDMYRMLESAGGNSTNFNITVPRTNGNGINNTTTRIYGTNSSVYTGPPLSTRQFTLGS